MLDERIGDIYHKQDSYCDNAVQTAKLIRLLFGHIEDKIRLFGRAEKVLALFFFLL
jgi:hypothetical protein